MTGPPIQDSLRRRMRAMHSLYEQAVTSMGPEHVNHVERVAGAGGRALVGLGA